jgi:hypothetical protein
MVLVTLMTVALAAVAVVGTALADSPSDPRATFHEGNATTCADVGFPGDTILFVNGANNGSDANVSGTVSGGGTTLNVTNTGGVDIHAIVVKGGNGYNQYSSIVPNMIPPLNNGGQIPAISHWFVCYGPPPPPTTGPPTTAPPTTAPSTTAPPTTARPGAAPPAPPAAPRPPVAAAPTAGAAAAVAGQPRTTG